jgi:drug/metabolite transporter (DMT)-like permease
MTWWSFALILAALITFVAGQLLLKKGMELTVERTSAAVGDRGYKAFLIAGISAMTISFFLTLGLLQRFDLSYLYPFQGLSVILIAITAAITLREKLTLQLAIGALLISAGIFLVSMS